jgi:hypothetical protein
LIVKNKKSIDVTELTAKRLLFKETVRKLEIFFFNQKLVCV